MIAQKGRAEFVEKLYERRNAAGSHTPPAMPLDRKEIPAQQKVNCLLKRQLYPSCLFNKELFDKLLNGLIQLLNRLVVMVFHRVHDAVVHVVLQNDLAGVVDGAADRGQLN